MLPFSTLSINCYYGWARGAEVLLLQVIINNDLINPVRLQATEIVKGRWGRS